MINTRPNVDPEGRYNQKETAEILCIDRSTVKRYEENGYILFKVRKAGKHKITTGKQILKCWEATCF